MPPLPKEHGAWVMLSVPLLLGAWVVHAALVPTVLLIVATLAAFCAQNLVRLWLRKRTTHQDLGWLALFAVIGLAALVPLLLWVPRWQDFAALGVLAIAFLTMQGFLLLIPAKKRLDRSLWGELAAIPALTLPGPAACALAMPLGSKALLVWGLSIAFFASGVFAVKLVLASAKFRKGLTSKERWQLGWPHVTYHLLLALGMITLHSPWLAIAFLPALLRAVLTYVQLDGKLPPLKKVGMREAALAVWFGCIAALTL